MKINLSDLSKTPARPILGTTRAQTTKSRAARTHRKKNPFSAKKRKQGKKMEAEIWKSMDPSLIGGFRHRLYDTQDWQDKTGYTNLIVGKQPADFLWLYKGVVYFIEAKSSANRLYYPTTGLKEHQISMGLHIIAEGGEHCHIIGLYQPHRRPQAWLIPTNQLATLIGWGIYGTTPLTRLSWSTVAQRGIEVPRIKGSLYDLSVLRYRQRVLE